MEAANAEVERGNQARQSDFAGAAERLRKQSVGEYEARPRAATRAGGGLRRADAGRGRRLLGWCLCAARLPAWLVSGRYRASSAGLWRYLSCSPCRLLRFLSAQRSPGPMPSFWVHVP